MFAERCSLGRFSDSETHQETVMLSRLVEILQLLVRLVELDSTSRRDPNVRDNPTTDFQYLEKSYSAPESLGEQPRPLALQAPAQTGKPEASSTMPKKRGRPPKVNRTEDSSNS